MKALDKLLEDSKEAGVSGKWFSVRWMPDPATEEVLNIGAGFMSKDGGVDWKILDDYQRLECLYSNKNIEFHAELAGRMVEDILRKDRTVRGRVSENLIIEDKGFAQGSDLESVVSRLYQQTVTLGRKDSRKKRKNFSPVSRESAFKIIKAEMKKNLDLNYEYYVEDNPIQTIEDSFGREDVYLPFKRKDGVATLASAAYANADRVYCNLFEGFRSVETAIKTGKAKDSAVFLVLPGDGLERETKTRVENEIDRFYTFLRRHDIHMESNVDAEVLGSDVSEWCLEAELA